MEFCPWKWLPGIEKDPEAMFGLRWEETCDGLVSPALDAMWESSRRYITCLSPDTPSLKQWSSNTGVQQNDLENSLKVQVPRIHQGFLT